MDAGIHSFLKLPLTSKHGRDFRTVVFRARESCGDLSVQVPPPEFLIGRSEVGSKHVRF